MTPDHEFQLVTTGIAVVPATAISIWALMSQRRRNEPRLQVKPSPVMVRTADGREVLSPNQWPGIVVVNTSSFPIRICNVGYRIGEKFYTFGKPLVFNGDADSSWPWSLGPHARVGFHLDLFTEAGRIFAENATAASSDNFLWEVGRAYAVTECGRWFYSRRLSRKCMRMLREMTPISAGMTISGFRNPFATANKLQL